MTSVIDGTSTIGRIGENQGLEGRLLKRKIKNSENVGDSLSFWAKIVTHTPLKMEIEFKFDDPA